MLLEDLLRAKIREVDRVDQRASRVALKRMVETGRLSVQDLDRVATPARGRRKSLRNLTVADLISMGIVTAEGAV